jgi:serine/threonine protein kinase
MASSNPLSLEKYDCANKLKFPDIQNEYEFNMSDIIDEHDTLRSSLSAVKKFLHKSTGKAMAVKLLPLPKSSISKYKRRTKQDEEKLFGLINEINIIKMLENSPNVVNFYGYGVHQGYLLMCMEVMDMSLNDFKCLHNCFHGQHKVPVFLLGYLTIALVNGLDFCHEKRIVHRDIKPSNILLRNGEVKLCDFGLSKKLYESDLAVSKVGTIAYWPPERFLHSEMGYDTSTDIWSLGITLLELIFGYLPYEWLNENLNLVNLQNQILNMSMDKFYDTFYSDMRVKGPDDRDLLNAFASETIIPEYQRAKLIPSMPEYKQKELKCIAGIKNMDSFDSCDSESISTANVNNNKKRPIPLPTRIGYYDASVIEFIERCLSNVAHRPDCKALKEMKFYNDFLKDYEQRRSECALKDIIKQYDVSFDKKFFKNSIF